MKDACELDTASYLSDLIFQIADSPPDSRLFFTVRQHMLDGLAASFIGFKSKIFHSLSGICSGRGDASGPVSEAPADITPCPDIGMLWAYAINASVYEDGCREGACHPSAAVLATVIALSEGRNWNAMGRAFVAGYDVMVRMARAGNPQLILRGFHPTAVMAPFAAAATASVLLRLDRNKTRNALCIAALGSSGLMASFKCGPTQPLQVAWGVRNGIMAALLAAEGHEGYPGIIDEGFYRAYLGQAPNPAPDLPLDYDHAVTGSYLKPYPGCRHLHPSIDAFAKILDQAQIMPEQMKVIRVGTYTAAVETEIHSLGSRGDAYFNLPYALAARAVLRRSDYDAFDERHFGNEAIRRLMPKVEVRIDPQIDLLYPRQRGSAVEVHTDDGTVLQERVMISLGEPENPLSADDTREKFRTCARNSLSEEDIGKVEMLLDPSEPSERISEIFRLMKEKAPACRPGVLGMDCRGVRCGG